MPIIRCQTHLEVYKERASAADLHELSGRGSNRRLTQFIAEDILGKLGKTRANKLVDIGCGDGTLLQLASPHIGLGYGILPNQEEVARVAAALSGYPQIAVLLGNACSLPEETSGADVIVCNGVFILLDEEDVSRSLAEMARIAEADAVVFLGEVPQIDEMAGRNYGDSLVRWLVWTAQNRGLRAFLDALSKCIKAWLFGEKLIIAPKRIFMAQPSRMIDLCEQHGFVVKEHWAHRELDTEGNVVSSTTRSDYLLQKKRH